MCFFFVWGMWNLLIFAANNASRRKELFQIIETQSKELSSRAIIVERSK